MWIGLGAYRLPRVFAFSSTETPLVDDYFNKSTLVALYLSPQRCPPF